MVALCVCPLPNPLRTQVNVKLEILMASDLVFMFGRFPHNRLLAKLECLYPLSIYKPFFRIYIYVRSQMMR